MIRSVWVALNLLVATIPLSLLVIGAGLLGVRGDLYERTARLWARWVLRASGVQVRLEGLDNVRGDRPHIIVSNHQSWFDVFALAAFVPGKYRFVAKKELAAIPLFGRAWQAAGHISIDRADTQSAIRSLDTAARAMREDNSSVVIFPEGTRSPTGKLLPFKKGAFMLALHNGVEVVPVAVVGSRAILARDDWRVRPGEMRVRFGRPIDTTDYGEEGRDALIARVRGEIERMLSDSATTPVARVCPPDNA